MEMKKIQNQSITIKIKRLLTVLTVLVVIVVAGAIPEPSEASSSDIIILEDNFEGYSMESPVFPDGWVRLNYAVS